MICTCQPHGSSRCSHAGCQTGPGTMSVIPAAHFMDSMDLFLSEQLLPKLLLTDLSTCPVPNVNKSLLSETSHVLSLRYTFLS